MPTGQRLLPTARAHLTPSQQRVPHPTARAGHQWRKAWEAFQWMRESDCEPDMTTYSAVLIALQIGGKWRLALDVYLQM